ncbi:MAG: preprotein translocase subunit SecY [Planctomycetota bacterium]
MNHPAFQLLRNEESRSRIVATLGLMFAFRIGHFVPLPGINIDALNASLERGGSLLGMLSAFSGGAWGQATVFALGIMPYISASIIFSILTKVSPRLEAVQKEGASGQKKINQWTRLVTVPLAIVQSLLVYIAVLAPDPAILGNGGLGAALIVILGLTAGAITVMWIGELITEHGIGNGASLLIMANIVATMPESLRQIFATNTGDAYYTTLKLIGIWLGIVVLIVFIQKGERRIPIQYARLTRGRQPYGGQRHYLPLKVNMAGVMPIIFASALFILPSVVFGALEWRALQNIFADTDGFVHVTLYMALVFVFCFFWNNLMFQPDEIANNLREHGSFIPGTRPGVKTAELIKRVLHRITLAGAIFLALIAVVPNFVTAGIPGLSGNLAYFLGGTSVLIVVGVALDMVDRLNAQLVMKNYEGFLGKGGATGTGVGTGWAKKS